MSVPDPEFVDQNLVEPDLVEPDLVQLGFSDARSGDLGIAGLGFEPLALAVVDLQPGAVEPVLGLWCLILERLPDAAML